MKKVRVTEKDVDRANKWGFFPTEIAVARTFNVEPNDLSVDKDGYLTIYGEEKQKFLIKSFHDSYLQYCRNWEIFQCSDAESPDFTGFVFSLKKATDTHLMTVALIYTSYFFSAKFSIVTF